MNEVLSTVPATAVTVVGHLVTFGLGWAACLWRSRNRNKVDQLEAMIRDAGKEANTELQSALVKARGVILRE